MSVFPAIFVSHGAPDVLLGDSAAKQFLAHLPATLAEQPAAILVVSAHWETQQPVVSAPDHNDTIHDFGGFAPELHAMRYPAMGAPAIAERVRSLASTAGVEVGIDRSRGLDHGAWVPLMLAWPQADIPVLQLSVQPDAGVAHHLALGAAIAALRREGVLILGSGSFTHDLKSYLPHRHDRDAQEPDWVAAFAGWMHDRLVADDRRALQDYRRHAPHAARNHPTEEHLLPLFVALGAGGPHGRARVLHQSATHGVLRMDAYAFD